MIHGLEEELRVSRAILDGKFDKKPTTYEECEALVDALRNPEGAASEAPASEAPPAAQNCSECKKECGERLLTCAQCKRAHYCGKACQVRAWRSGHKRVCCGTRDISVNPCPPDACPVSSVGGALPAMPFLVAVGASGACEGVRPQVVTGLG